MSFHSCEEQPIVARVLILIIDLTICLAGYLKLLPSPSAVKDYNFKIVVRFIFQIALTIKAVSFLCLFLRHERAGYKEEKLNSRTTSICYKPISIEPLLHFFEHRKDNNIILKY
uniref:Uncharacterized protein n=1 Tax=Glossina brevipalpis TaxID=37001 RepID=A0A1A9W988_9MUSC